VTVTGTVWMAVLMTVLVGVTVTVEMLVVTTVDWVTVVVAATMPAHEQAEEYLTVPEQAEAYVGTWLGAFVVAAQVPALAGRVMVTARASIAPGTVGRGIISGLPVRLLSGAPVTVTGATEKAVTSTSVGWMNVTVSNMLVATETIVSCMVVNCVCAITFVRVT